MGKDSTTLRACPRQYSVHNPWRRAAILVAALLAFRLPARPAGDAGCRFILGFGTLHRDLPFIVGGCLQNQTFAANGDVEQRTRSGMLFWRKHTLAGTRDVTAFSDGYRTWLNGPEGLQLRLNTQRFAWEPDAGAPGTTIAGSSRVPSPASRR